MSEVLSAVSLEVRSYIYFIGRSYHIVDAIGVLIRQKSELLNFRPHRSDLTVTRGDRLVCAKYVEMFVSYLCKELSHSIRDVPPALRILEVKWRAAELRHVAL